MRLGVAVLGLLLVGAWGALCHAWYRLEAHDVRDALRVEIQHHLESTESHLTSELLHVTAMLRALSQSHSVHSLLTDTPEPDAIDDLRTVFFPLMSRIVEFRLLDRDGMERLRLDRVNTSDYRFVNNDQLISRAHAHCFLEGIAMPVGKVFIEAVSVPEQLDGQLLPSLPLLRVSMRVPSGGEDKPGGLMVIYLDGRLLYWRDVASPLPVHDSVRQIAPGYVYGLQQGKVEVSKTSTLSPITGRLSMQREFRPASVLPLGQAQQDMVWRFGVSMPTGWLRERMRQTEHQAWAVWAVGTLLTGLLLLGLANSRSKAMRGDAERQALLADVKALTQRLIVAHEEERSSLARTLHDEVSQELAAVQMRLGGLAEDCLQDRCIAEPRVRDEEKNIGRVIEALRGQIRLLRPPQLEAIGLRASLLGLLEQMQKKVMVELDVMIDESVDELGEDQALGVFRMVQEAVINIQRHAAGATVVRLRMELHDGCVTLLVEDNGRGFDMHGKVNGFGLMGLREQAGAMGGVVHIDSSPGKGMRLHVRVPVQPENQSK